MTSRSDIRRNSGLVLLSQSLRLVSTAVVFILIARSYGPEEFGSYAAAHTLATIFLLVADFGFDVLLTWEVGKRRDEVQTIVMRYGSAKLVLSGGAMALMILIGAVVDVSATTRTLIFILSASVFFSALANFFIALFRGVEQFHRETMISLLSNSLLLVATAFAIYLQAHIWIIAGVFVVSRLSAAVFGLMSASNVIRFTGIRWAFTGKEELRRIGIFGAHAIFATLFFTQDTLLLSFWKGDKEVGVYQAAFKIIGLLFLVPDVLMTAVLPALSKAHEDDPERWFRLGGMLEKALLAFGVPAAVLLATGPDLVIGLVYGLDSFGESVQVLRVFSGVVIVHCLTIAFGLLLTTSGRQAVRMIVVVGATVLNLTLNAFLIPAQGTVGAAYASLLTLLAVGAGYSMPLRSLFLKWIGERRVIGTLLASGAIAVLTFVGRSVAGWTAVPLGVLLSGGTMLLAFSREERRLLLGRAWLAPTIVSPPEK